MRLVLSTWRVSPAEARAEIAGKETMYVQSGSNISLTCTVREQLVVPGTGAQIKLEGNSWAILLRLKISIFIFDGESLPNSRDSLIFFARDRITEMPASIRYGHSSDYFRDLK
jgi:hypothetical protein